MDILSFNKRLNQLINEQKSLLSKKNEIKGTGNGIYNRYKYPVLTKKHIPITWTYDLDFNTNPYLMERIGVNCVFNPGAILLNEKIHLVVRVEGYDRKSFFAVAQSDTGIDGFKFWDYPITMPETKDPDINVYDMRLVKHEDGWIYGLFCTERKDPDASKGDTSSAIASCGIARTKDLMLWDRLDDLKTKSQQQRNVVLHPEFIDGQYAFYTRPQDGFIETGKGAGIGWGLSKSIEHAEIENEYIFDNKEYHTIKELKNGQGPTPIKTDKGWLHIAHGVRTTASGLRYVLYTFLTDIDKPEKIIACPGGYFIAPKEEERVGDVSNVVFCNGAVKKENGDIFIYYASSDTRIHVATTTVDKMLDYVINTPEDQLRSRACVEVRKLLIEKNLELIKEKEVTI